MITYVDKCSYLKFQLYFKWQSHSWAALDLLLGWKPPNCVRNETEHGTELILALSLPCKFHSSKSTREHVETHMTPFIFQSAESSANSYCY